MGDTGMQIPRVYSGFRGVDFRGEEINIVRSPDSLNVWKDYKETESIRTRPGLELKFAFDKPVYGVFFHKDMMLVHSGTELWAVENGKVTDRMMEGLKENNSSGFSFGDSFYFKDGKHYVRLGENGINGFDLGHVPTTSIARKPTKKPGELSGGTIYEDVNMLTGTRINTFIGDGESRLYYLDAQDIDTIYNPVKVEILNADTGDWDTLPNDNSHYTVDSKTGLVNFKAGKAPAAPPTDGQDNVRITFTKTVPGYKERILNCTMLQVFDNRVFFSGNPDYPNTVWHSALNDPFYCSDLDYYHEGVDAAPVTGLVAGNNNLWVFREPSQANTTVFYHTPTIDSEYGKIYPSAHSSITTGCIGKAINFNDDIVFFSDRGMEGISGDITTEQVVAHRSVLVDRKLLPRTEEERIAYRDMVLEEWEGYLFVFIGNKVFLADSRAVFTNDNHFEYEWFYWELDKKVICTNVHNGVMYLGTDDGVYTLTDLACDIESYWVTPKDKFGYPQMQKTTNKRGCVAEATGDISVYAKTENTGFELIGTYENVKDYFVSRIKRKKFKDIQLKFHSNTRFSLETVTLEAWIGGYIKR